MSETAAAPAPSQPVTQTARRSKSSSSPWWFIVPGAGVCLLVALFYSVVDLGIVRGTEFCPADYSIRHYVYYEIPLIHLQVYPITHRLDAGSLEGHLRDNKLIPPVDPQAPREWHLVQVTRGRNAPQRADADLLVTYLRTNGEKPDAAWQSWTEKNPELAKVLWDAVTALARRGDYVLVPDLFAMAADAESPETLKTSLQRHLAERYRRWAVAEQKANRITRAFELLDRAAEYAEAAGLDAEKKQLNDLRIQWAPP